MRHTKLALATMALAVLAACGGSTPGDQTPKIKYSAQVSFGDSLSDVGTYAVGSVKAMGGGKYTINGDNTKVNAALTGKNWTELVAAQLGLAAPCAAQTGLDGEASLGFFVPVETHTGCFGYAQGGARVTDPIGPGNKALGKALGQLTVPVVTQVKNHLAIVGGKFKGDELVFVMAGGNDVLQLLDNLEIAATAAGSSAFGSSLVGQLAAGATNPLTAAQAIGQAMALEAARAGHTDASVVGAAVGAAAVQPGNAAVAAQAVYGPMVATATAAGTKAGTDYAAAHAAEQVGAMSKAGKELVALVKTQIVGNGANYVAVNNLPDVATSPSGKAESAATQQLIMAMVNAFNAELSAGFNGESKVLLIDVFSSSHDQAINPGQYGLTNVVDTACDLSEAKNPLALSLACSANNLIAGDVSHYAFADKVHPTPYNNLLLARYVSEKLIVRGWL
ncbi:esterase [Oxalobacteraceae bacterium]|nr:esterase [Oxalobacteraceae bacterium]